MRSAGGVGQQSHRDRGRDAHGSFAADEAPAQVVARLIGLEAPEARDRPVGEHDVERAHVRRGDARSEAMRPAGVGGDVAADRARLLRRRIGRVVQPEMGDRAREIEVEHARLHPRDPLLGIDLENAVELCGDDDDGVVDGSRAAREAGTTPSHHERPIVACSHPHHCRDFVTAAREAHRGRAAARDACVARVERELEWFCAHSIGIE